MLSSAFVGAAAVLAWPTRWRWPVLALGAPFALLVAFSRLYLGVHFPSDILAGWLASLAWVLGVSLVLYGRPAKPTEGAEPRDDKVKG
jgi:undecaprenyl-diphosphatase